ncbi:MAG: pantoate--beta-alanine ligase, partial [Microbacterium sp.]
RSLRAAQDALAGGETDVAALAAAGRAVLAEAGLAPEYLALVDPDTLAPVTRVDRPALLAVAVRVGATRLIDNVVLAPGTERTPS